jgi:predicted dehydrogenase
MKCAIIGCGRIAPSHLRAAIANNIKIVGLCDCIENKAENLKNKYNETIKDQTTTTNLIDAECYQSSEVMLKDLREKDLLPDFISIASDSKNHFTIAMDILENKINVVIEKPITLSLKDTDKLIEKAKQMNCLLSVCQQNRFNKSSLLVKKAIDNGAFGKLSNGSVAIRWSRSRDYYDQDAWRGKWISDGGTLMNQDIHGIDLLRWFMGGNIKSIYGLLANRLHPYLEVEDIGVGTLLFENGAVATIEGTSNVLNDDLEERITIIGEKGCVTLSGIVANKIEFYHFEDEKYNEEFSIIQNQDFESVYGNGHDALYANIKESIINNTQPFVSGKDGRDALETILALYKSHKLEHKVLLPLKEASTKDMMNLNLGKI